MDWFRWWHGTVSDPKFEVVARKASVRVGDVVAIWAALLEHASGVTQCNAEKRRGDVTDFDFESIDVHFGFDDGVSERIYNALVEKFLIVDGIIASWEKRQPKREDSSQERVRRHRQAKKEAASKTDVTQVKRDVTHGNAPDKDTDTDKETMYTATDVAVVDGEAADLAPSEKVPKCPHQKILQLFGQSLPELPQPVPDLWEGARAKNLAARWKWVLTSRRGDGTLRATNEAEALDFFRRLFEYIADSDFLTGRDGRWTNCDLGWIVNRENFAKIIQGNYENKGAE